MRRRHRVLVIVSLLLLGVCSTSLLVQRQTALLQSAGAAPVRPTTVPEGSPDASSRPFTSGDEGDGSERGPAPLAPRP